jgi:hypothetical protein
MRIIFAAVRRAATLSEASKKECARYGQARVDAAQARQALTGHITEITANFEADAISKSCRHGARIGMLDCAGAAAI